MTGHMNELHPTPNAEALAEMEMQPDRYDVISLGSSWSRSTIEDAKHARARVVVAIGANVSRDELNSLLIESLVAAHAFLETKHTLRLELPEPPADPAPLELVVDQEGSSTE